MKDEKGEPPLGGLGLSKLSKASICIALCLFLFGIVLLTQRLNTKPSSADIPQTQVQADQKPYKQPSITQQYTNWKTYPSTMLKLQFSYPPAWNITKQEIKSVVTLNNSTIQSGTITLSYNGTTMMSLMINPQLGYCENGGCTRNEFMTRSGVKVEKIIEGNFIYYNFAIGQTHIFIPVTKAQDLQTIEEITKSFSAI